MTGISNRIIHAYFIMAIALFFLQIPFGVYLASSYALSYPQVVVDWLPFSTARAIHTNLLVLWLLLGLMGGGYFMAMVEGELKEIFSPLLAFMQLAILSVTGIVGVVGFVFGWTQGRPLLELPFHLDIAIVVGTLVFLFNIALTMFKGWTENKKFSAISFMLLLGVAFTALLYLPHIPFYKNIVNDWTAWWINIHGWVEGSWELIASAVMAFLLVALTGVDRKVVNKWLYIEAGLFLFTGIAGIGHHFYWTGHPEYWKPIGNIFSGMEIIPLILMYWDTKRHISHKPEVLDLLAGKMVFWSVVLTLVGAGILGLGQTFSFVNYSTHGSQVTTSHGHLAFYGAFVLLLLAVFYVLIPKFKGITAFSEKRGYVALWIMNISMWIMTALFLVAGIIQTCLERVAGWQYMDTQAVMRWWMAFAALAGIGFFIGATVMVYDLLFMKEAKCANCV